MFKNFMNNNFQLFIDPPHQNIVKDNGVVFEKLLPLLIFNTNNNFLLLFCGWGSKVKFLNTNPLHLRIFGGGFLSICI